MKTVFIGDEYYSKSGTTMSSIYELDASGSLTRTDWGKIQIALKGGEDVHIRPATEEELGQMDMQLGKLIRERVERRNRDTE